VKAPPAGHDEFLRVEYTALAEYYGKIITFRFTTASFFVAAVALVLQIASPKPAHYVLLFAVSLGIWLVELRNRSIFRSLLSRAWAIESRWATADSPPLFMNMAPSEVPEELSHGKLPLVRDETRILLLPRFHAPIATHTVGFDILYLSVMSFSVWALRTPNLELPVAATIDPILAMFTFGIIYLGFTALQATTFQPSELKPWQRCVGGLLGLVLIGGGALVVALAVAKAL
jgi:hypothetical protein